MSSKNPFYDPDEDEVDDEDFLRKSRPTGYMLPNSNNTAAPQQQQQTNSAELHRQQMLQRRREIEERTLDSSTRSLSLLYESEKVGQATAEELNRQKEQLKSTEHRLDDINSTLRQSERHLNGMKSIFGGIRNYFANKGNTAAAANAATAPVASSPYQQTNSQQQPQQPQPSSQSHPGMRVRGFDTMEAGGNADAVLDRNLEEMSMGLGRLKGLAENLNKELDEHNDIIDRLDDKTSSTNIRVERQNRDMSKLLKK